MPHSRPAAGTYARVLLVEDSRRMQEILTESVQGIPGLELMGVVDNAPEALSAFGRHRPDTVILDLSLRLGNGLEVLRAIKQQAPGCHVVVFTTYDTEPYRTGCMLAGASHFFSKNRQHRELLQHLHDLGGVPNANPPAHGSGINL